MTDKPQRPTTKELLQIIRQKRIEELHAHLENGVYIDGCCFDLARSVDAAIEELLTQHMQKRVYEQLLRSGAQAKN